MYIYIYNWLEVTHDTQRSPRSKMSVIYIYSQKDRRCIYTCSQKDRHYIYIYIYIYTYFHFSFMYNDRIT